MSCLGSNKFAQIYENVNLNSEFVCVCVCVCINKYIKYREKIKQVSSALILKFKKMKFDTVSTFSPSVCHEVI